MLTLGGRSHTLIFSVIPEPRRNGKNMKKTILLSGDSLRNFELDIEEHNLSR